MARKLIAIIAVILLVCSSAVALFCIFRSYSGLPRNHPAYEAAERITKEGIVEGFGDGGKYFAEDAGVSAQELICALYRIDGEVPVTPTFEGLSPGSISEEEYAKAFEWAAYNGIIFCTYSVGSTVEGIDGYISEAFRYDDIEYYVSMLEDADEDTGYAISGAVPSGLKIKDITCSDAVLAMYYYACDYLNMEITSYDDTDIASQAMYKLYNKSTIQLEDADIISASWNWALDAGIVEPYADNTLRPDATLTRAEFAVMLERFMDYVK